ncbi:uncharacterized protein LOC134519635 [Chroicocephalus ridibundus]|uniref:uncharacterized protein LOC134519635 n=1 Tax=Chroicocephalus ridibundus TaxID=1192867 RepID=UPI002FDCD9C1
MGPGRGSRPLSDGAQGGGKQAEGHQGMRQRDSGLESHTASCDRNQAGGTPATDNSLSSLHLTECGNLEDNGKKFLPGATGAAVVTAQRLPHLARCHCVTGNPLYLGREREYDCSETFLSSPVREDRSSVRGRRAGEEGNRLRGAAKQGADGGGFAGVRDTAGGARHDPEGGRGGGLLDCAAPAPPPPPPPPSPPAIQRATAAVSTGQVSPELSLPAGACLLARPWPPHPPRSWPGLADCPRRGKAASRALARGTGFSDRGGEEDIAVINSCGVVAEEWAEMFLLITRAPLPALGFLLALMVT